jgi:hypothetical protein
LIAFSAIVIFAAGTLIPSRGAARIMPVDMLCYE